MPYSNDTVTKNESHRIPAKRGVTRKIAGFDPGHAAPSATHLMVTWSMYATHVHWTIESLRAFNCQFASRGENNKPSPIHSQRIDLPVIILEIENGRLHHLHSDATPIHSSPTLV